MRFSLIFILILISCSKWTKIPYYELNSRTDFKDQFRTMAEHDELMNGKKWPYIMEIKGEKNLLYYGSWHTSDPEHPQIADIVKKWNEFKPTVAVTENRPGFYLGGLSSAVESHGEFGALKDLAISKDLKIYSLEPS